MKTLVWARMFGFLGALLVAIGVLPTFLLQWLWPDADAVIPFLLFAGVAPLGAVSLALALVLGLVAMFQRRQNGQRTGPAR